MKDFSKDFPLLKQRVNGNRLVYLDSAATSQKPSIVIDAISTFYEKNNSNVKRGIYPLAGKATSMVEGVRTKTVKFVNAKSNDEIIFVRNTTEAINLLAYSMSHNTKANDIVASAVTEHHSNFVPWQMLAARTNSRFKVLDFSTSFDINFSDLQKAKVLAISHVSNVLGEILDLPKIIRNVRKRNPGILIIVDAAQSVAHAPIDVQEIDCDFLTFSGHKMFAGMGVGVLYGKKNNLEKLDPFLYGGQMVDQVSINKTTFRSSPDRFEAGTLAAADILSLGTAIDYIQGIGFSKITKHESDLTKYTFERLAHIKGLKIVGPGYSKKRLGVISFELSDIHPHDIAQILGDRGICVRAGHHCAMPLHTRLGIQSSTRLSLSIYNKKEDIDAFIEGIEAVKEMFKK